MSADARLLRISRAVGKVVAPVLNPRQPLAAIPYALAVPGLRTQPNTVSPNVIGGFSGNTISAGVVGATADGDGAFVWADRSNSFASFGNADPNVFRVRAAGGVGFYSNPQATSGVALLPGAGAWNTLSDRNAKANFTSATPRSRDRSISSRHGWRRWSGVAQLARMFRLAMRR